MLSSGALTPGTERLKSSAFGSSAPEMRIFVCAFVLFVCLARTGSGSPLFQMPEIKQDTAIFVGNLLDSLSVYVSNVLRSAGEISRRFIGASGLGPGIVTRKTVVTTNRLPSTKGSNSSDVQFNIRKQVLTAPASNTGGSGNSQVIEVASDVSSSQAVSSTDFRLNTQQQSSQGSSVLSGPGEGTSGVALPSAEVQNLPSSNTNPSPGASAANRNVPILRKEILLSNKVRTLE